MNTSTEQLHNLPLYNKCVFTLTDKTKST